MTQWHPLFARLLRPLLEGHYEIQTGVPVGDAPRAADLVLLRRTADAEPPFEGLWRWLTLWNVLEFKGPTVSARVGDLDLLLELGLGVHRRLNEERQKQRQPPVERPDVSLWYLAAHLGRRFLRDARELLGELEPLGPGVWRVRHLRRWLVLVSSRDVPVERDTLPVHLLLREPDEARREVLNELAGQLDLVSIYGGWMATMFPALWEEVREMARRVKQSMVGPVFDLRPVIEHLGFAEVIRQVGLKRVLEEVDLNRIMAELGPEWLLSRLTPKHRRELQRHLQGNGG